MKRIFTVLLVSALLLGTCACLPFSASAEGAEGDFEYEIVDGVATITGYHGAGGDVVIPSVLDGAPVTTIGDFAFYGNDRLTSVTIPESVEWIELYAFSHCPSLIGLTVAEGNGSYYSKGNCIIGMHTTTLTHGCAASVIPDDVTGIKTAAFAGCDGLTGIEIPESVTWIGDNAFADCVNLTGITFPDGMAYIYDGAFSNCEGLTEIVIPANVEYIGKAAFSGTGLRKLTVAEGNPFYYSEGNCIITKEDRTLTHGCDASVIPGDVKAIGNNAFSGCYELTDLVIPDGVTAIGKEAFSTCFALKSVVIPGSVTTIGAWAFDTCFELTEVVLEEGVSEIGEEAFFACYALKSIVIPQSVTRMGSRIFRFCRGLIDIYCRAEEQPEDWSQYWAEDCNAAVLWGYTPASKPILGDLYGNGSIDAADYLLLKRYCLGTFKLTDAQKAVADVNKDGTIDAHDYMLVKRHVLGTYKIA